MERLLKKCCTVLMNDRAGRFKRTVRAEDMRNLVRDLGLDIEVVGVESLNHMLSLLRQLVIDEAPRVAVAGGDGTVTTAAQLLAGTTTALGILPQGTANNVATALRLPQDLPSALRVLQEGEVTCMDLGKVGGRYFAETAGVGLFADALTIYGGRANKNVLRSLYAVAKILLNFKAHRMRLTIDGHVVEERSVMCVAANAFRMGHGFPIAPGAKVTDGLLDIVVFGDLRRNELWSYCRAIKNQMHFSLPKVRVLQGKEVRIETRRRMSVHADDRVPCTTPATITLEPGVLKVIVAEQRI